MHNSVYATGHLAALNTGFGQSNFGQPNFGQPILHCQLDSVNHAGLQHYVFDSKSVGTWCWAAIPLHEPHKNRGQVLSSQSDFPSFSDHALSAGNSLCRQKQATLRYSHRATKISHSVSPKFNTPCHQNQPHRTWLMTVGMPS